MEPGKSAVSTPYFSGSLRMCMVAPRFSLVGDPAGWHGQS